MSWNLMIFNAASAEDEPEPMGSVEGVTSELNLIFPGLTWPSSSECELRVQRGFILRLIVEAGIVQSIDTDGGYDHLKQFAALCKKKRWIIVDAQEGESVDLDDPYSWYEERA